MNVEAEPFPLISVIIPTYNRKDSLLRTLDSLSQQSYPAERFEVIVVDDGSSDGTEEVLRATAYPFRLNYLQQAHLGVGAARQLGLEQALGSLLLYLDDDMICDQAVIAEHVSAHALTPKAVLKGQVILILDDPTSVFATHRSGTPDLPFSQERDLLSISFQQVFAGHFSIGRECALAAGGWIDQPRDYGFQDLEFMYRCANHGMEMLYASGATTYHHDHATTLAKVCQRLERASSSAATHLFVQHPELRSQLPMFREKEPIAWHQDPPRLILRKLARQIIWSRPAMWAMQRAVPILERRAPESALLPSFYQWIVSGYIFRGYRDGLRAAAQRPAA